MNSFAVGQSSCTQIRNDGYFSHSLVRDFCLHGFAGEQCMTHKHEAIDPISSMYPLYDSRWEHDACGTGFLAQLSGEASHAIVQTALEALNRLTHRGAQDADTDTYDGAGILTQIPKVL